MELANYVMQLAIQNKFPVFAQQQQAQMQQLQQMQAQQQQGQQPQIPPQILQQMQGQIPPAQIPTLEQQQIINHQKPQTTTDAATKSIMLGMSPVV